MPVHRAVIDECQDSLLGVGADAFDALRGHCLSPSRPLPLALALSPSLPPSFSPSPSPSLPLPLPLPLSLCPSPSLSRGREALRGLCIGRPECIPSVIKGVHALTAARKGTYAGSRYIFPTAPFDNETLRGL